MSVNSLNLKNSNPPLLSSGKNNKNVSFKGLTKNYEKRIYPHAQSLAAINGVYKNNIAGRPPQEIINAIKELNNGSIDSDVKKLMKSFNEAIYELREAEKTIPDCVDAVDIKEYMTQFFEIMQTGSPEQQAEFLNKLASFSVISEDFVNEATSKAANKIEKACKEIGIVPQNGHVEMKFLGSGSYGHAFNISFKDENDNKIFHDKTIKMYKDKDVEDKIQEISTKKAGEYMKSVTFEEYWDLIEGVLKKFLFAGNLMSEDELQQVLDMTKENLESSFEQIKNSQLDNSVDDFMKLIMDAQKNCHGVLPEANRALYINRANNRNLKETNFVEPHYFDVKNRYAFMETADDELPAVKKQLDLSKIGLKHLDLEQNVANTVANRVIDYGGIEPDYSQVEDYYLY